MVQMSHDEGLYHIHPASTYTGAGVADALDTGRFVLIADLASSDSIDIFFPFYVYTVIQGSYKIRMTGRRDDDISRSPEWVDAYRK